MEQPIVIAVLAGTVREGRRSINAAKYVAEFGRQLPDVEIVFVDPRDLNLPGDGDDPAKRDPTYAAVTERADAFYIVTPEYNHSLPSSLKRMLDSEFGNYFHKPVAFGGVSNGNWGGVRVCEALLPVVHTMGMAVIKTELYFPRVQDIFDEDGSMKPEYQERYQQNLAKAYEELLWYARLLKRGRPQAETPVEGNH
jgi:NAD(P)H-dependent FMN reductase